MMNRQLLGEKRNDLQMVSVDAPLPGFVLQVLILLALLGPFLAFFLMPGAGLIVPKTAWVGLLLILAAVGIFGLMFSYIEDAAKLR
ncbi:MAG: hypothetical protein U0105_04365 [Candidatus Obscuribacterales bacterium]